MHNLVLRCFTRFSTLYASLLLSLIASAVAPGALAQVTDFATLDVPGATLTRPFDVNNFGVIVGSFDDQSGTHGFIYQGDHSQLSKFLGPN
jgi:hypothetical protein